MAVNYGQVAIVPKGVWNAETQYKVNNLVEYDGSSYVAKVQPPVGTLPTDTSYWQVSAAGTKKATPDSLGTVMPDGTTTEIKEDGKLSAKTAQQNALGVVKGSDDIIVGEDGNLTVNTTFEQATEIANIIAGEAIKSVLGKVSKAIATTMSLDENALLKNMISGIDVNDGSKVPSSAYIHSLVERIGMGTALEGGFDNLTAGLNSVNNNLSNFHFYNDLSQLGLSEGASINNLLEKMPAPSVGVFYCLSKSITGLPFDTQCMVTIFKNGNPFRIEVQDIWSGRTYVAIYSGGTVGKFVEYALKSDLSPIGTVFWSGLEEIQCVKDTLVSGQMTINLPAGTYVIFGHAVLDAGTSTGVLQINNAKAVEAYQTYYSSVYRRHVTVSCFFNFTEQVTLSVGLFDSANTKATTCEVCAVRIK